MLVRNVGKRRTKSAVRKSANRISPLKIDPTRTQTMRRQFVAKLKRRFARFKLALHDLVVKEDAFGLIPRKLMTLANHQLTTNDRWRFNTNPEKIRAFQEWLRLNLGGSLRNKTEEQLWEAYIQAGFRKGAGRAFDDTTRAGLFDKEGMDFYSGTREQFLRDSFGRPEAVDKVKMMAGRSFDELSNVTDDMANKIGRRLVDGLVRGSNPIEIARLMIKDVDISFNRASVIARTEMIRAHAEGQLMALKDLGVEEVGVMVEWSTAGDERVCELCEPLEGVVLKLDEAAGMIPRHPNCRCAYIPANVGEDTKDQERSKSDIEDAIKESLSLDGKEPGDDAWGPGEPISTARPTSALNQFSAAMNTKGKV